LCQKKRLDLPLVLDVTYITEPEETALILLKIPSFSVSKDHSCWPQCWTGKSHSLD